MKAKAARLARSDAVSWAPMLLSSCNVNFIQLFVASSVILSASMSVWTRGIRDVILSADLHRAEKKCLQNFVKQEPERARQNSKARIFILTTAQNLTGAF